MFLEGREVRFGNCDHPPQLLVATAEGKICGGRPFRTSRDAFADGLKRIIPGIDPRGGATEWIGRSKSEA